MSDPDELPTLCFVALRAYDVVSGHSSDRHIGGAEVQQSRIARALIRRGYRVKFVTLDVGQRDGEDHDGITVHGAYRADTGGPGLRAVHPRMTRLWAALKRADADIYYQRTSDSVTGLVAGFCRWHHRLFVFAVGHDGDCDPELPFCPTLRERVLYRYGLVRADAVVAQTRSQRDALRQRFDVESVLIPSCIPPSDAPCAPAWQGRPRLVWIGRFAPEKRLEWLLDVAGRCPEIDFDVVGDGGKSSYTEGLKARAADLPNVHCHGYVVHTEIARYYRSAVALINTSVSEGFPNTFLEAWSQGMTVVTSFDPDGIVSEFGLGLHATTAESLSAAARKICFDPRLRAECEGNAHAYYCAHHTVDIAARAYDQLFRELASSSSREHLHTKIGGTESEVA